MKGTALDLHRRAAAVFGTLVHSVRNDQWEAPTPCAAWDVYALVSHVVGENRWVPLLFAGRTVADVGDLLEATFSVRTRRPPGTTPWVRRIVPSAMTAPWYRRCTFPWAMFRARSTSLNSSPTLSFTRGTSPVRLAATKPWMRHWSRPLPPGSPVWRSPHAKPASSGHRYRSPTPPTRKPSCSPTSAETRRSRRTHRARRLRRRAGGCRTSSKKPAGRWMPRLPRTRSEARSRRLAGS